MKIEFREEYVSQIPALQLLMNLGYEYLTPNEALRLRGNRKSNVVLTDVLEYWLKENNQIEYRGQVYAFSESNIQRAIDTITGLNPSVGLLPENKRMTELLTNPPSFEQTIEGNRRSFTMNYIDWAHPENNIYHVTDEFAVQRRAHNETRRPDIVLFVNGIPLVVIECKRPDLKGAVIIQDIEDEENKFLGKALAESIEQTIRNQNADEIPHLFAYSQLLLAVATNEARYGTTNTSEKYWAVWKEDPDFHRGDVEAAVHELINTPLSEAQKEHLYGHRRYARRIRNYFDQLAEAPRLPTVQDTTLYALLRPSRLLELAQQFIVFDNGVKKIARYQQYFAIKATIDRVVPLRNQQRDGGVIWHTTGSGKSLTMVMLAKALALHPSISNPRLILVTDRVNLDKQIHDTFNACGKTAIKAKSGKNLGKLIREARTDIITTVIDKFENAEKTGVRDDSPDIFVLVDESHRSQYGVSHAKMKQVFKNACYIGFTGTPLLKKDKETARKFGGFIHKYTMRQAVEDKAVVPLLYEGRVVDLNVDRDPLDQWFERRTRGLTEEQQTDLKLKMSRSDEVNKVDQRLMLIAFDIAEHFRKNVNQGFKAMLATSSKAVALKYRRYLREEGIDCEVVISPPDTREGNLEVGESQMPEIERFWRDMLAQHGTEDKYNDNLKASFSEPDGLEMLIVVDKLLVGFDEPLNTVLYIDKPLKEHNLLQAIARVNRLAENKDYGYIIDYRGVLGELNEAMETYDALEGFDAEDISGTVTDVSQIIAQLPQHHEQLLAVFNPVENKSDLEAMQRFLEPDDIRDKFYDALNTFAKSLKVALGSELFYEETPEKRIRRYKDDLKFFHNLRQAAKQRYAEAIDYRDYEAKIRGLMDTHIKAEQITQITALVNIFDVEAFEQEIAKVMGENAKADTILHRLKKTAIERMEQDPAFYRKFSQMIDETIQAYRDGRIDEAEKLQRANELLDEAQSGQDSSLPQQLRVYRHAGAYYGLLEESAEELGFNGLAADDLANLAITFEEIIEGRKIRDWVTNPDIQGQIYNDLEDCVYEFQNRQQLSLASAQIDLIIDNIMDVAVKRDGLF